MFDAFADTEGIKTTKHQGTIIAIVLTTFIVSGGLLFYLFTPLGYYEQAAAKLHGGMTQTQVDALLGRPVGAYMKQTPDGQIEIEFQAYRIFGAHAPMLVKFSDESSSGVAVEWCGRNPDAQESGTDPSGQLYTRLLNCEAVEQ